MAQVKKAVPTLDSQLQMLERFMPAGYRRGVRGGLATLDPVTGLPLDADGNPVSGSGGGVPDLNNAALTGNSTSDTPADDASGNEIVTAAWARGLRMTVDQLPPGQIWPYVCLDGIQPLRSTITDRTDIRVRWIMPDPPSFATGYAIAGDLWTRQLWAST